jgi:hypothetical protein
MKNLRFPFIVGTFAILLPLSSMAAESKVTVANRGLLNTWLSDQLLAFTNCDIGGQVRAQYEAKENAGSSPDSVPDRDFVGDYIREFVQTKPVNGGSTDADFVYVQAKFLF